MASSLRGGVVPFAQPQGTPQLGSVSRLAPSSGKGGGAGEGPADAGGRAGAWGHKRGGLGSISIMQLPGGQMQRCQSHTVSVGHEM